MTNQNSDTMIQVLQPHLDQEEKNAVLLALDSHWWGLGPRTAQFEQDFAAYLGAAHAVGTNSATAALHLALLALGVGPGDEVLVPSLTFVSTVHAVEYVEATPVFCDIEPDTLCISLEDAKAKVTARTKAIIPVHFAGHACRMNEIWQLAREHSLFVVEDAAHACGSEYNKVKVGGHGLSDAVCFSFHPVKNLATPDGGMLVTPTDEVDELARTLRWCGISKSTWARTEARKRYGWFYEVRQVGYKYHMNDITAAIGLVQLGKLDRLNARRRELAKRYTTLLSDLDWLELLVEKPHTRSSWHLYVVKTEHRNELNLHLRDRNIATGVHYLPIHLQPYYSQRYPGIYLPVTESVWERLLTLPLYPDLTDEQQDCIVEAVHDFRR